MIVNCVTKKSHTIGVGDGHGVGHECLILPHPHLFLYTVFFRIPPQRPATEETVSVTRRRRRKAPCLRQRVEPMRNAGFHVGRSRVRSSTAAALGKASRARQSHTCLVARLIAGQKLPHGSHQPLVEPKEGRREGLAQQTGCYVGQLEGRSRLTAAAVLEGVRPGHTCLETQGCRR